MQHAEEFTLPRLSTAQTLPSLPKSPDKKIYLQELSDRIHPIFSVLDENLFQYQVAKLATQDLMILSHEEVPPLACAYCVFALGADESAGRCTDICSMYLSATYNLWTYIVSVPYLASVQALLLLTITLKSWNKDGCGGQSLAQAIRVAQSLGLNHANVAKTETIPGEPECSIDGDLDARC